MSKQKVITPINLCVTMRSKRLTRTDEIIGEILRIVDHKATINYELTNDTLSNLLISKSKNRLFNGTIIDPVSWTLLANPPMRMSDKFSFKHIQQNINNYDIYTIKDGTTITLYHHKNEWKMGSNRSYDIRHQTWISDKTYKQLFDDVMTKYFPEFSYGKLNVNCWYTIGFRHHELHPLIEDPESAWLISAYDRKSYKPVLCPGVPLQLPIDDKCVNMLKTNDRALDMFYKNKTIHYGYIIKSQNESYVMESTLYRIIKKYIYDIPRLVNIEECPKNRIKYITLRAYLSKNTDNLATFKKIFPQYQNKFEQYDKYFTKLSDDIYQRLHRKLDDYEKSTDPNIDIIKLICNNLCSLGDFNVLDNDSTSIIMDYLMDMTYVSLYINLIND